MAFNIKILVANALNFKVNYNTNNKILNLYLARTKEKG